MDRHGGLGKTGEMKISWMGLRAEQAERPAVLVRERCAFAQAAGEIRDARRLEHELAAGAEQAGELEKDVECLGSRDVLKHVLGVDLAEMALRQEGEVCRL